MAKQKPHKRHQLAAAQHLRDLRFKQISPEEIQAWIRNCLVEGLKGNIWLFGLLNICSSSCPDKVLDSLPDIYRRIDEVAEGIRLGDTNEALRILESIGEDAYEGITVPELRAAFEDHLAFLRFSVRTRALPKAPDSPLPLGDKTLWEELYRLGLEDYPDPAAQLLLLQAEVLRLAPKERRELGEDFCGFLAKESVKLIDRLLSPETPVWTNGDSDSRVLLADLILWYLSRTDDEAYRRLAAAWTHAPEKLFDAEDIPRIVNVASSHLLMSQTVPTGFPVEAPEGAKLARSRLPAATSLLKLFDKTRRRALFPHDEGLSPLDVRKCLAETRLLRQTVSERYAYDCFLERLDFEKVLADCLSKGFGRQTGTDRRELLKTLKTAQKPDLMPLPLFLSRYQTAGTLMPFVPCLGFTEKETERFTGHLHRFLEALDLRIEMGRIQPLLAAGARWQLDSASHASFVAAETFCGPKASEFNAMHFMFLPVSLLEAAVGWLQSRGKTKSENPFTHPETLRTFLRRAQEMLAAMRHFTEDVRRECPKVTPMEAARIRTLAAAFEAARQSGSVARRLFALKQLTHVLSPLAGRLRETPFALPAIAAALLEDRQLYQAIVAEPLGSAELGIPLQRFGDEVSERLRRMTLQVARADKSAERRLLRALKQNAEKR